MKCLVIGGITIDVEGSPKGKLLLRDSNLGKVKIKPGGVGRNIATNMSLMGLDTTIISYIGEDYLGDVALADLKNHHISYIVEKDKDSSTAIYLSLLNEEGDMEVALNDMEVMKKMSVNFFKKHISKIREYDLIVLDCNLEKESLDYLGESLKDKTLILDTVSFAKAARARDILQYIDSIKPNVLEAEALLGVKIDSEEKVIDAANTLLKKGVKNVYLTLDKDGVYYTDGKSSGFLRPKSRIKLRSATGAGDSFTASIVLGKDENMNIKDIANLGMKASEIAMESLDSVNENMSYIEMKRRLEEC